MPIKINTAEKVFRNYDVKLSLLVPGRAIKVSLGSMEVLARNLLLAKSARPLLFQKIPFISHHEKFEFYSRTSAHRGCRINLPLPWMFWFILHLL